MRILRVVLDYLLVPGLTWAASVLAGFAWISQEIDISRVLFKGFLSLLVVAALSFQTGYKGYWKAGRKYYFFVVFIAPIVVGTLGLLAGLVFGHR